MKAGRGCGFPVAQSTSCLPGPAAHDCRPRSYICGQQTKLFRRLSFHLIVLASAFTCIHASAQSASPDTGRDANVPIDGGAIIMPPKTIDQKPSSGDRLENRGKSIEQPEKPHGDADATGRKRSVQGEGSATERAATRPDASQPGFGSGKDSTGTSCKGPKELCRQNSAR